MNKPPIEVLLDSVAWTPLPDHEDTGDGIPYAVMEGVLNVGTHSLRCYQLNTGVRVFDADDVHAFFGGGEHG